MVGKQLKLVRQIGKGGFGDVDLVVDEQGNEFARKSFAQNQPLTPEILENVVRRFSKEVRIQGGITHRNIVPILASDLDAVPPYYLMPVATSSLDRDLAKDRTLNGSFLSALNDIVAGLEELHSMQIFHRDLKPHNVLRFGDDGNSYYAISDFGLISMKESALSGLTKTGMGKGSDYYTAPEISQDLKRSSAQSDIYSLGCILHEMVGTEDRIPFREIREPGEFSGVLLGCTRDDPSKRFGSAKAVLDAILSIEYEPQGEVSSGSVDYIAILSSEKTPEPVFWPKLADFLKNSANKADIAAVCGKLTTGKIRELCNENIQIANRIGVIFSEWVGNTAFNFDLCDAITNRLEEFYDRCDFETKVECLLAMLKMGTSHNRWYVERTFFRLCGAGMDDNLAKRLVVQLHVTGKSVCAMISHLELSISVKRDNLHQRLVKALNDICK